MRIVLWMNRASREEAMKITLQIGPAGYRDRSAMPCSLRLGMHENDHVPVPGQDIPQPPVQLAQAPFLEIPERGVAIAPRHKESGTWPLGGFGVDAEVTSASAPATQQQLMNPAGILEDSTPGQTLIGQR